MVLRMAILVLAVLLAAPARAQEDNDSSIETLDLTMELMPEGATRPDAVTRVIELPAAVAEAARENAANAAAQSSEARGNREDGLERAREASERGRERAQEVREDLGRGPPDWDPPGPPDASPGNGPGRGGPPDTPGPPGN